MLPANPYDLHEINFNNLKELARPIEWNSTMVDQIRQTSALGDQVRATKAVLTCPNCGSYNEIIDLYDLEGHYYCECHTGLRLSRKSKETALSDTRNIIDNLDTRNPFKNPFESGDLNSILYPQVATSKVKTGTISKPSKKTSQTKCKIEKPPKISPKIQAETDEGLINLANEPFNDEDLLD